MNDDIQSIREEIFDRIIFGLMLVSVAGSLLALTIGEFSGLWFLRAAALLIVTLIAYLVRRNGQFEVAAYVLVFGLIGLVAGIFLQPGPSAPFIPYLFIPITIIAGLILSHVATMVTALFSVSLLAGVVVLTEQLSATTLSDFSPPIILTIFAALLIIESHRYINRLGAHLEKYRNLFKERGTALREVFDRANELQKKAANLEQELLHARAQAGQIEQRSAQRDNRIYDLIEGAVAELDTARGELADIIRRIEMTPDPSEQSDLFKKAWEKINYLDNLTPRLIEMAQLDNERVSLDYQSASIKDVIDRAVAVARGRTGDKDVQLRYRVPDELPAVQVDPDRVEEALLHLLDNATKYTDEGIIEVQAELTEEDEIIIFISDTGIGMYREEMDLIFQKFGHGRGTLAQQRRGIGLGLPVSKRLIELHGGRMWVSSVLGVGSTFYLTLPLQPPSQTSPTSPPPVTTAATTVSTAASVFSAVPAASAKPEPEAPTQTEGDREATLISSKLETGVPSVLDSGRSPAIEARLDEEDQTVLSPPSLSKPSFGPPVARFGPTYIGRFGSILLTLLIIIAGIAAALAILNRSEGPTETAIEKQSLSSDTPASAAAQTPTQQATPTLPPTTTPVATPTLPSTATPVATEQPSTLSTTAPTVTPTNPSAKVTTAPSSPTPMEEPSPTLLPPSATPRATQTTTIVPDAEQNGVVPAAVVETDLTQPQRLVFFTTEGQNLAMTLRNIGDQAEAKLQLAVKASPTSGLSWSPTGQLLFVDSSPGDREIYVIDANNGQSVQLTQAEGDDIQPAWSPDSRQIAFSSNRTGNFDIFVMNADGSNSRQLTKSRGYDEWPAWSFDGRKLAFVSDRDGNVEIYTMNVDGSNQQRLTNHPAEDWPAAWSPDGSRLVFASNRDSNWNLYLIDADGNNLVRLTNQAANERNPVWSRDGRTIAFIYDGDGNGDIYTLPAPAGVPSDIPRAAWTQITNTPADEQAPTWLR